MSLNLRPYTTRVLEEGSTRMLRGILIKICAASPEHQALVERLVNDYDVDVTEDEDGDDHDDGW
jgi:hypothetical protein